MATNTKNYGLIKPTQDDFYDIDIHNQNMDKVDETLHNHEVGSKVNSESGVHGFRYYNDEFQVQNADGTWVEVESGGIAPSDVSNINVKVSDGKLTVSWSDPSDTVVDGQTVCTWKGTKLVQKVGAFPETPKDGVIVLDNQVRDKYKNNGFEVTGLTNGVTYYFALFPYSTNGAVNTSTSNRFEGTPKAYRRMSVLVNLSNNNPETSVIYADDAANMTPGDASWDDFFGHYPVLLKDGVEVGKLNRDNFNKFENGTDADITSGDAGDAMICFPRMGLRITTNGTTMTISMTDNPNDSSYEYYAHNRGGTQKDKFYLGVYKGYVQSSRLRSLKGKTPTTNISISTSRTRAQANGSGYEQSAFYQLVFRQAMFILKYKTLDSQTAIGKGYTASSNTNFAATGGTEAWGMDCELISKIQPSDMTSGNHHVKLFGIEDFWGNIFEWIDGVKTDSERSILTSTNNFNDNATGYINHGNGGVAINLANYLSVSLGTTNTGFLAKYVSGSATTFFCDYATLYNYCVAKFGGYWNGTSEAGVFNLTVSDDVGSVASFNGARLMYL